MYRCTGIPIKVGSVCACATSKKAENIHTVHLYIIFFESSIIMCNKTQLFKNDILYQAQNILLCWIFLKAKFFTVYNNFSLTFLCILCKSANSFGNV